MQIKAIVIASHEAMRIIAIMIAAHEAMHYR